MTTKVDNRPALGSWAPGDYFNLCAGCRCEFMGDKRAMRCADCAYATTPDTLEIPEFLRRAK